MKAPPLHIVLHIYKSAGKSLLRTFARNLRKPELLRLYAPKLSLDKAEASANPGWNEAQVLEYLRVNATPETRCIFGHMAFYGIHELPQFAGREVRYIVFLREPVARVVSLYNYLLHHSVNVWHQEIVDNGWSLEEWFRGSRGLWLHNGQMRQLLLWHRKDVLTERNLTDEHLADAKRVLDQMWFIGATESFAADAQVLARRMGFKKEPTAHVVNASSGERTIDEVVARMIREDNALDVALYDHAQALRRLNASDYNLLSRPAPAKAEESGGLKALVRLPWR